MKKLFSLLLCFVIALSCVTIAFADGKDCSLTISYKDDKTPLTGANISIYRVAALADGKYSLTGNFAADPVTVDISSDSASSATALALYGYAIASGREADANDKTNKNGYVYFGGLQEGLYLIAIDGLLLGSNYYGPACYLVALPGIDEETREVVYDIISKPKSKIICSDSTEVTNLRVLKKWNDDAESHDPITVTLYRDGAVFNRAELNEENGWRYVWDNLEAAHNYVAVEESVPDGYKVSVSREEDAFVITNTKEVIIIPSNPTDPTNPTSPTSPTDPTSHTNPDNPDNPGGIHIDPVVPAVVVPSVIITGVVIGTTAAVIPVIIGTSVVIGVTLIAIPIIIIAAKHHNEAQNPENPETAEELPYTGVLWWPVPVMAFSGISLIYAGKKLKRKKDEEAE